MVTTDHNLRFDFATGPLTHKLLFGVDYLRANSEGTTIYEMAGPIDIFDPVYMRALFEYGYHLAAAGYPWEKGHPRFLARVPSASPGLSPSAGSETA